MAQAVDSSLEGTSPRSTILVGAASPDQPQIRNMNNNSSDQNGVVDNHKDASKDKSSADETENNNENSNKGTSPEKTPAPASVEEEPLSPQPRMANTAAGGPTGAFYGYQQQQQPPNPQQHLTATPRGSYYGEPPSPSIPTQFAAGTAAFPNPFGGANPSPLSPPRATTVAPMGSGAVLPPASPLFPRLNSSGSANGLTAAANALQQQPDSSRNPPASPSFGYLGGGYPSYSNVVAAPLGTPVPSEEATTTTTTTTSSWNNVTGDRNSQQQPSPQVQPGVPMPYGIASRAGSGGRTYSFDETMLPPAVMGGDLQQGDASNPAYSPYSTASSNATGTLFAAPWPYSAGPPDTPYGTTPPSPLQPRPTAPHMPPPPPHHMGYPPHHALGMRPMVGPPHHHYPPPPPGAAGGHFGGYVTSSPGPPIQTTASNKGPDGANLFIFHIPNQFTNLDMYQLFEPYGNLLSVRIMVEKDSGRSRGFGFVSYDSPESAALAIKALNGFAIGNKRLKVQHKQIRPKDMMHDNHHRDSASSSTNGYGGETTTVSFSPGMGVPPAGPTGWSYNSGGGNNGGNDRKAPPPEGPKPDESTELTSTSTGAETPLNLGSSSVDQPLSPLANLGSLQTALPDVGGPPGGSNTGAAAGNPPE